MNLRLYNEWCIFLDKEMNVIDPSTFARKYAKHPIFLFAFVLYKWKDIFRNALPETSIQIDLMNLNINQIYDEVKKNAIDNPDSIFSERHLQDLVLLMSKEAKTLRAIKKPNHQQ